MQDWEMELARELHWLQGKLLHSNVKPRRAVKKLVELAGIVKQSTQGVLPATKAKKPPKAPEAPVKPVPPIKRLNDVSAVFIHWRGRTGRSRAKLTDDRRRHINARLADGLTVEQLKRLIDYVATNPFHQGENDRGKKYDWIENIMHSTAQVERTLEDIEDRQFEPPRDKELERMEREAEEALDAGDVEGYNDLQQQIRHRNKDR